MVLFKKKEFGFAPLGKIKPAKINGNVVTSKLLHYQFTLPGGFVFQPQEKYNNATQNYTEFSAISQDGVYISVTINVSDEETARAVLPTWNTSKHRCEMAILQGVYANFNPGLVEHIDFMGLPCAHYSGILKREFKNGCKYYVEKYIFLAPYCVISFDVQCREGREFLTYGLFKHFEIGLPQSYWL